MGVVYLAQLPDGPRVALKVIRRDIVGDDEGRLRLAREVNSLRLIRSERIAEILDADPWGPVPFVATRYVPGLSLHDHVRQEGPIVGADLTWFADCLAAAIEAVHQAGVVHRDIKPANVVMEGRSPVLIDFGLARLADDPRLTVTGWLLGTPGYLSPEVLYGEEATAASDVHSWAATVTFAGTGLPPFGTGPAEAVTDRVRRGHHSLTGLPTHLQDLVGACLAVDPDQRPSLEEVREVLAGWRAAPGIVAPTAAGMALPTMPIAAALEVQANSETVALPEAAADNPPITQSLITESPITESPITESPITESLATESLAAVPVAPTAPYTVAYAPLPTLVEPAVPISATPAPELERVGTPDVDGDLTAVEQSEPGRLTWAHRIRLGSLLVAAAAAVGVWMAAYPYLTLAVGCLGVWLLRGLWHTGDAHRGRLERRGAKWYDVPHTVVSTPVHLFTTIPGSLMLIAWAGGIGLAAGLLAYALARGPAETLMIMGAATAVSAWWGPGGAEIRSMLQPVAIRLSQRVIAWIVTGALIAAIAVFGLVRLDAGGTNWAPTTNGPLSSEPGGLGIPDWLR